ncbi:MFS transporter [Rothia sp. (in: high G+C Gram-positive bacteria)]|uniref:MFS transporter n=1 Tax=Rothia sp. (in: high G+C Gram-positive bacteria) TaxID=1885016 RepID=UPI000EEE1B0C|nr:MFS transporter [Rothia sp. (in: high G+C Gram-positive bacteria)]
MPSHNLPPGTLASTPASTDDLNDRLDQLPVTRRHARLLGVTGIGWALDAMDIGLISFVMAALIAHWHISSGQASLLASLGFLGMALGATFGGKLSDKYGRRHIFAITLLVYGVATGLSALALTFTTLLVLRFIVGLGLGAELPVASTYISEFSPRRVRGRMVVILEAFWALGWIAAALIGTFVVGSSENGWRFALAFGCIPAAYAAVVRLGLPESVRYLVSRGRREEAQQVVESFERSRPLRASSETTQAIIEESPDLGAQAATSIWSPALKRRTGALWVIWFCVNLAYYGAFIWIPSLLVAAGFDLVKSFTFTLIMTLAQLPGYAVSAWLIEAWGRRATLATFLAGSALSAVAYGLATEPWMIITAGCFLSFFNLGAWGALYAVGPELYPVQLRGAGTGAAAGFGRLASIAAPLIVPVLVGLVGVTGLFAVFAAAFCTAAVTTLFLPETKAR